MRYEMVDTSIGPVPVSIPNDIPISKKDYYVSYNDHDVSIYGCDTTALVIGQMEKFYILNGNHVSGYKDLPDLAACLDYFRDNSERISKFSDHLEE